MRGNGCAHSGSRASSPVTKTRLLAGAALLGFATLFALTLSAAAATPAVTVTTPEPSYLQSLDVKDASLLFAVGTATIVRSTDGGNSWRTYSVPDVGAIAGASFFDRSRWWLASGAS